MMTWAEALAATRFIVDGQGQRTDVVLPLEAWQTLMNRLEDLEDQALVRDWLARRRAAASPSDLGLIPWENVEIELDALDN